MRIWGLCRWSWDGFSGISRWPVVDQPLTTDHQQNTKGESSSPFLTNSAEAVWRCVIENHLSETLNHRSLLFTASSLFIPIHLFISVFNFYSPSAVRHLCGQWLHKLVLTDTHSGCIHSVPSWPPGSAGAVTCRGGSLVCLDSLFPADLWLSTADSIIQSQVSLSGSVGPGDIIVTPPFPSSHAVSNGGPELVKGPCE